ncbi:helix-turn-helix domain-containing protein [Arthrobacter sp. MDT2-16]
MKISVADASRRLGVTGARVRQLIAAGDLPATRVGRAWVLNAVDVERYSPRRQGRPITETSAWAFLRYLSGNPSREISREVLGQHERWAHHLRAVSDEELVGVFMSFVRNRATRTDLAVDRADLETLRSDERIVLSGVSHPETRLLANAEAEGYVTSRDFAKVQRELLLIPSTAGGHDANVVLHICDAIPRPLPRAVIAADLAEHRGVREADEATRLLRELLND